MNTITSEGILEKLQHAYDVVKHKAPRRIRLEDDLVDDLELDSLDLIDLVSVLEEEFPAAVVDTVIERAPDFRTVADLVAGFESAS